MRDEMKDKVRAMLESGRYGSKVRDVECRVQGTEYGGWSIGARTWLQLMCCTLAGEQGCP